jgi:plastocyanin
MAVDAAIATKGIRMPQDCTSSLHRRSNRPPRAYRSTICSAAASAALILLTAASSALAADTMSAAAGAARYFMPDAAASKIVTIATSGSAAASIVVLTEAVAVKETGPKATLEHFGEIYAFSPNFIAVHRDEPTRLTLWNLQPDDDHDFMLEDPTIKNSPGGHALMHLRLAPLSKTSYIYTFHREGLFGFRCAVHQPEMNGQILVLPPR